MKKLLLISGIILIILGCQKQKEADQPIDKWNGYESFYKSGAIIKTLWAGQHHNIGTVTYEFKEEEDSVFFYVTYNTSDEGNTNNTGFESGWSISLTHMYAGLWDDMPKNNNKGLPKIGRFPYSHSYNPSVQTDIYKINVDKLNNYDETGFIVATHAEVSKSGQNETAWGDWDEDCSFADRGWGGYTFTYYQPSEINNVLAYGIAEDEDGDLALKLINLTDGTSTPISGVPVGTGTDGLAWDPVLNDLFVASSTDLFVIPMDDDTASLTLAGTLNFAPISASFYDGSYYYLNDNNQISVVTFTETGVIDTDILMYTIVGTTANDITISDDGLIYIIGESLSETTTLSSYNLILTSDPYVLIKPDLQNQSGEQIPSSSNLIFGADGTLYVVASFSDSSDITSLTGEQLNVTITTTTDDVGVVGTPGPFQ